jgi:hypothetical protein
MLYIFFYKFFGRNPLRIYLDCRKQSSMQNGHNVSLKVLYQIYEVLIADVNNMGYLFILVGTTKIAVSEKNPCTFSYRVLC